MKTYQQPQTQVLTLLSDRLCQELVVSLGSNFDLKYGGQSGTGYKPV